MQKNEEKKWSWKREKIRSGEEYGIGGIRSIGSKVLGLFGVGRG